MSETQYGVIHEQGDLNAFKPLTKEENETLLNQQRKDANNAGSKEESK